MRIISLLPAATEWVAACGAIGELVGRSHACDEPRAVHALTAVTRPAFTSTGDSAAIDEQVQGRLREGLSLYEVDFEKLRALRPELVLTQAQCEVCAVSLPQLKKLLAGWTRQQPRLLSLEPMTLKQVLDAGLRIGRATGHVETAMRFLAQKEERLKAFRVRAGLRRRASSRELPTVACIEWLEPLMTAGHWMPDVVEMAGGRAVLSRRGHPSRTIAWAALQEADPDVLALMPCGLSIEETRRDLHYLTERPGWSTLRAVREERVVLFDGRSYFNRPGPRLYRSIELLAAALHPDEAVLEEPAPWELQPLSEVERTHVSGS